MHRLQVQTTAIVVSELGAAEPGRRWLDNLLLAMQAQTITILFPLDGSGQQGHLARCTAVEGAGLSRGQLLSTIYTFYQVPLSPYCSQLQS